MFDLYIEHKTLRRFHLRERAHVVFPRRTYNSIFSRRAMRFQGTRSLYKKWELRYDECVRLPKQTRSTKDRRETSVLFMCQKKEGRGYG